MKILICGDVVGKAGRQALVKYLPLIRERLDPDFVIVNGENAAHGFGITRKIFNQFLELGVDMVTTGNHVWDQKEIINWIEDEDRILRPLNLPEGTIGRGHAIFESGKGHRVMMIHPMGRLFMKPIDDPFASVDTALRNHKLGRGVGGAFDAIIVDFHAEITSEKVGMGHHLDGRVSLVVGTHTHIPTADAHILSGGTGFQTDLGMCGDYDSVIGMNKETAVNRFTEKQPPGRLHPAEGEGTLCAVYAEFNDLTGLTEKISPVRLGGKLPDTWPIGLTD